MYFSERWTLLSPCNFLINNIWFELLLKETFYTKCHIKYFFCVIAQFEPDFVVLLLIFSCSTANFFASYFLEMFAVVKYE